MCPPFSGSKYGASLAKSAGIIKQRLVGEKHLKLVLSPDEGRTLIDAIAFNVDLVVWPNAAINQVQLVYKLDVNEWQGKQSLQLLVEKIAPL